MLSDHDTRTISKLLSSGYYIILTGEKWSLKSFIVKFLTLILTGKWTNYSHVLMNCDNVIDENAVSSFKFVEAVPKYGVHYIDFNTAFRCDNVCLLTPRTVDNEEWTRIIDGLLQQTGKPYDSLFDLSNNTKVSCVELVLDALKSSDYKEDFANFDNLINSTGNLVPQMFKDCPDFSVVFEK